MKWAVLLAGAAALATIAGVAWTIYHDKLKDAQEAATRQTATKTEMNPFGRVPPKTQTAV